MSEPEKRPQAARLTVVGVLNALLSATFLVLAAYIAWSSTLISGRDALQLRLFAALMAAYSVWRWIRNAIRARRNDD